MRSKVLTLHVTVEEVADYFEGRLPEPRESDLEVHLADCDACTDKARQWFAFSRIYNHWTAQAHGRAYRQAQLRARRRPPPAENIGPFRPSP